MSNSNDTFSQQLEALQSVIFLLEKQQCDLTVFENKLSAVIPKDELETFENDLCIIDHIHLLQQAMSNSIDNITDEIENARG